MVHRHVFRGDVMRLWSASWALSANEVVATRCQRRFPSNAAPWVVCCRDKGSPTTTLLGQDTVLAWIRPAAATVRCPSPSSIPQPDAAEMDLTERPGDLLCTLSWAGGLKDDALPTFWDSAGDRRNAACTVGR